MSLSCQHEPFLSQVKTGASKDLYSLIIFNDEAGTPQNIRCKPLSTVQDKLVSCLRSIVPCYGTSYGAGLSMALEVCEQAEKSGQNICQHVVIFLSDGAVRCDSWVV